ncbi:MAG: LysM peptidoglycan-binding domain-containing protein [Chloroflexi bacterium]|nr:LysM peptidoglycan-binding domain-containing protein [Chloroflexota bacterium]
MLAAGCFQPAGAGLEATSLAQALPTFTPIPSATPTDTETPAPENTPTDIPSPTIEFLVTETPITPEVGITEVALAQDIEPIWQTATAIYLEQIGGVPVQEPTQEQAIDPLLLTATALVREATQTAEYPLTASAMPPVFFTPTWTQPVVVPTSQPILPGNDCIHQVQSVGENLFRIGLNYGVHYLDIAYYPPNSIVNPNLIYLGQTIVIPGCGSTGQVPPPTWTPGPTVSYPTYTGGYPTYTGNFPTFSGQPFSYTVQPGDTLFRLSLSYGVPISTLVANNPQIVNINLIYVGDTLIIG